MNPSPLGARANARYPTQHLWCRALSVASCSLAFGLDPSSEGDVGPGEDQIVLRNILRSR